MSGATRRYDCCGHCDHDGNDPPHETPCPEGCTGDSVSACPPPEYYQPEAWIAPGHFCHEEF